LIVSTTITWIFGRSIINTQSLEAMGIDFPGERGSSDQKTTYTETNNIPDVCNFLSLGGFHKFSKVPLSLAVLSYTFFYLVYTIAFYHMEVSNIPTLILFPILILADIWWNYSNNCFPIASCILSLIVAGGLGVLWSYIVQQKMPNMQYLIVGSNRQMCMKPSEQQLICTQN